MEGSKEVLGLWAGQSEGAKFWLQVLTELKNRGVADIFIACVDGLKGFPQAIETVFPKTQVQLCIRGTPLQSRPLRQIVLSAPSGNRPSSCAFLTHSAHHLVD